MNPASISRWIAGYVVGLGLTCALAACFDPQYGAGVVCSERQTCPPGLICGSDGLCSTTPARCGDSAIRGAETCDDGDELDTGNGCSARCERNDTCGDGIVQVLFEACDRAASPSCKADCSGEDPVSTTYRIAGTVRGLVGTGLRLRLEGIEELAIVADGAFELATRLPAGTQIQVSVAAQPDAPVQVCAVENGARTIAGDIDDLRVTCAPPRYRLLLSVLGAKGTVVLLVSGRSVSIDGNGVVELDRLPDGARYEVDVVTTPDAPLQGCVLLGNQGSINGADATVSLHCWDAYRVGGIVRGLLPNSKVVLSLGGKALLQSNGWFQFPERLRVGIDYAVTAAPDPDSAYGHQCALDGTGTGPGHGDVDSVVVTCTPTPYKVAATVTGLAGTGLVLVDGVRNMESPVVRSGDVLRVLAAGNSYDYSVRRQPVSPSQDCRVVSGKGTVTKHDVVITVECTTRVSVGGTVSGLDRANAVTLALRHGTEEVTLPPISSDDDFAFTGIASGTSYRVVIKSQPSSQLCAIRRGSGTVADADIDDIEVTCTEWCFRLDNDDGENLQPGGWFDACVALPGGIVTVRLVDVDGQEIYNASGAKRAVWTPEQLTSTAPTTEQSDRANHDRLVTLDTGDKLMITSRNSSRSGCGGSLGWGYGIYISGADMPVHFHKILVNSYRHPNGTVRDFMNWTAGHEIAWRNGERMNTCMAAPLAPFRGTFTVDIEPVRDE